MIVGSEFENDKDDDLQWQQHDCYGEVLRIIADGCIRHYENALRILGKDEPELLRKLEKPRKGFDHRVMQPMHDIMAGYWRWKTGRHEPHIPGLEPNSIEDWKSWARREVDDWAFYSPEMIRHIIIALAHQNTERGYDAEDVALGVLRERYRSMLERD